MRDVTVSFYPDQESIEEVRGLLDALSSGLPESDFTPGVPLPPKENTTDGEPNTTDGPDSAGFPEGDARAGTIDLDSDGLPWDVRIHTVKKTKLSKTDAWKKKRGVDDALVLEVEAELRAAMAAPVTVATAPAPAAPAPVESVEPTRYLTTDGGAWTHAELIVSMYTDEQIAALPVAPVEAETVATVITTFPALMSEITSQQKTELEVLAACQKVGLDNLSMVANRSDLIPAVATELGL